MLPGKGDKRKKPDTDSRAATETWDETALAHSSVAAPSEEVESFWEKAASARPSSAACTGSSAASTEEVDSLWERAASARPSSAACTGSTKREDSDPAFATKPAIPEGSLEKLYAAAQDAAQETEMSLLQEVRSLGHYPKYMKNPSSTDEKKEVSLRNRLNKSISSMSLESKAYLSAQKRLPKQERAQHILRKVLQLGRMPKSLFTTADERVNVGTQLAAAAS